MSNTLNIEGYSMSVPTDRMIVAGISGGRTSAMMAALLPESAILCFENTGREHPKTYEFLRNLDEALGGRIVWLEYVAPQYGERPGALSFKQVDYWTADRTGKPFSDFMEAMAAYRHVQKGLGPVAPWARMRLCTAYMKARVQDAYIRSLGLGDHYTAVGLRSDEPNRVSRLMLQSTKHNKMLCPLSDAGLNKKAVLDFWTKQSFDLDLQEYQGNCTGCFLKDQSDLSRAMMEDDTDPEWWIAMESKYQLFGGRDFVGYAALRREGPLRLSIEAAHMAGAQPLNDGSVDDRRFKALVIQERRRAKNQRSAFSCNCEGSATIAGLDEDGEEQLLLFSIAEQSGVIGEVAL